MCKVYGSHWESLPEHLRSGITIYIPPLLIGSSHGSCVRVRHHRHDRASHSDRLMRHAAHVRVHLIAHVTIAPLHACSRSRSRVQASAHDSMLTRGTCAEASPRLPRRRAMRARTPIKGQAPAASSRRAFAAATPHHARKACQMTHDD